jgi:hyperosmotically inducible protein
MKHKSLVIIGILLFSAGTLLASEAYQGDPESRSAELEQRISTAVLSSARYGVFDGVSFEVDGGEVVLAGFVVVPMTKEEIGRHVAKVDGISKVTNNIEILPLSGMDASIRRQIYKKLFSTADMYRYAMGASPSIHIIVKGGRVTLEGFVSSKTDKKIALLASRGVPGVFSIENNLIIAD